MSSIPQCAPWDRFPSGGSWVVGSLALTAPAITSKYGVEFSHGVEDGLGPYSLAAIRAGSAGQLWLIAYDHSPVSGAEVMADLSVGREQALTELWRATRWDIRMFTWVTPFVAAPGSPGLSEAMGIAPRHLTARETDVVGMLTEGASTGAIAARLGVSASAVRKHIALLRLKFGAASTAELRARLEALRMAPPPEPFRHSA